MAQRDDRPVQKHRDPTYEDFLRSVEALTQIIVLRLQAADDEIVRLAEAIAGLAAQTRDLDVRVADLAAHVVGQDRSRATDPRGHSVDAVPEGRPGRQPKLRLKGRNAAAK